MGNYRDNYYGSILDPLHNDIKLSEIEKWCISQPIFSRLRKVKQNTFLYYVFPSANHTRFEHSIGVMHIAGKIFDACKENYATGNKKMEKYKKDRPSIFFDLNTLGGKEELFYQELRLAALLHDLGHGPLSHLFDSFAISKKSFLRIVNDDPVLSKYYNGFKKLINDNKGKVEHEIISCALIFILLNSLIEENAKNSEKFSKSVGTIIREIRPERVVKLIEPNFPNLLDFIDDSGTNYNVFFSRIITAFPIDADRMDYLLRDSYFSGVTYGIYDINRIFASFMAISLQQQVQLIFKESGIDSMLRFIQSRSHLYNQVYFHKTNRAANAMLSYATETNKDKKKLLDDMVDFDALISFYVKNSDEYFLIETVNRELVDDGYEAKVLNELIDRKLFKRVFQKKIVLVSPDKAKSKKYFEAETEKIKKIKTKIDKNLEPLKSQGIFAVADLYQNETYKDVEKSVLIAQKEHGDYVAVKDWQKIGTEFQLMDMNILMVRIYMRRTFNNSNDYEAKRTAILKEVESEIRKLDKYKG